MNHNSYPSLMEQDHDRERETYHECTQTQMDVILDPSILSPSGVEVKVEEPKPWARLVPSDPSSGMRMLDFFERKTCENGIFHKHVLGRSRRSEHVIEDARVSSSHCMIFCQRIEVGGQSSLVPCVVDQSANGTYVNGSRLRKGARHVLKNGDEVALVNPISAGLKISFITQIFLNQHRNDSYFHSTDSEAADAGLRRRGETVRQMLHQGRNINDHYDLVKIVGEGAYGQVYVAIERTTGVQRAVKVVDTAKAALSSPTFLNTLLAEAEIMRTLQHPLIVQLEDVFATGATFYFVMELLSGGDLFDRVVKKGFYLERDAVPLMRKLFTAIAFIHSRGVAHRDLKIENIMLESVHNDVDIKVTDFGLAKSGDAYQTFCGTPNYYAPEVLERKHNVRNDAKYSTIADMWSCGVIMYVILCGEMPWKGPNPEAELRKGRFATNVTRWASLSPSAKSLIGSLLQPNPRLRLTAEEALQHDWFQEASTDRPSPATRSTRKTTSTIQISMSVIQENFELSNIDGATTHSSVSSSMMSRRSSTRLALKTQEDSAPAVTAASIPEQSKGMHTRSETKKRPHSSAMQLAHSVSMRCDAATSDDLCEVVAEGMAPVKRTRTVVQRSIKNK